MYSSLLTAKLRSGATTARHAGGSSHHTVKARTASPSQQVSGCGNSSQGDASHSSSGRAVAHSSVSSRHTPPLESRDSLSLASAVFSGRNRRAVAMRMRAAAHGNVARMGVNAWHAEGAAPSARASTESNRSTLLSDCGDMGVIVDPDAMPPADEDSTAPSQLHEPGAIQGL
mmetsp:Transcript_9606/g.20060  ORF Transcript_9606/g.20060 Transcript_9606/m.20060 type:complete len:172 (+) Transcript_9606:51-566(+)